MKSKVLIILLLLTMVRAASKYYDGPIRPYEFGFNIEGHQHRKESKDKNGIIMGEFGFITADNVYHVTVYATDEDGNFKIVSMKNYKLGPTAPPPSPAPPVTPRATTPARTASTTPQPFRIITTAKTIVPLTTPKPSNIAACSGCKIPEPPSSSTTTTTTAQPETSTQYVPPFKIVNKNDLESSSAVVTTTTTVAPTVAGAQDTPQKLIDKVASKPTPAGQRPPASGSGGGAVERSDDRASKERTPSERTSSERQPPKGMQPDSKSVTELSRDTARVSGERSSIDRSNAGTKPATGSSTGPPTRESDDPMKLVEIHTANMIQHILNGLLYRFNYTAGYHGHHEEGDRQGNKEGGYYAIGRDGIRRGVSYKANEFGFQPHIKFEKVTPEETPREETEKQAGLKGFDFKWFYGS